MSQSARKIPPEERVVTRMQEGKMVTEPLLAAVARLQEYAARFGDPSRSLADELVAERHASAKDE